MLFGILQACAQAPTVISSDKTQAGPVTKLLKSAIQKAMLKHSFSKFLLIITAILLISWGRMGHQAIGYIAASHLTPKTAQAIKDLLSNETLADISTYADEIRPDSFFQFTAPWHYIDVPADENFSQFKESVNQQSIPNLYTALLHWERVLVDPGSNRSLKIFALKMVVHLIGDAHQPLHVARAEDKGGNEIHLRFESEPTNLHTLWDTKLIEHKGLSAPDLARYCDFANPEDIKTWQADPLIVWLYESNHISNHLYEDNPENKKLGQDYYDQHIEMVRQRIDQAGIRLAGILNQSFDPQHVIVQQHDTTVCDKVYDGKFLKKSQLTFLNMHAAYPHQRISVLIIGADRDKFKTAPEKLYAGKFICVTGVMKKFKDRLEILVTDPNQITLK